MKILIPIIYLISLSAVYITFLNNESSELQYILYNDMGSGDYKESSTARFDVANFDFPDISQSALPMKGIAARYFFYGGKFDEAIEMLNSSKKSNPYIMFNQSLLGEIYSYLGVRDSALYYNEIAFTGLPFSSKHFIELSKSYVQVKNYKKIDSIFEIAKVKMQPPVWLAYLSSLLTNEENISHIGKKNANDASNYFSENSHSELMLAAKYVKFGTENINKSLEYEAKGSDHFDKSEWLLAAEAYENASRLNPSQYTHFENIGISYFKFGYYDKAIDNLNFVIDSLNPKTGKSEYVIAEIYNQLGDSKLACDYIYKSSNYNYRPAFQRIGEYCIDQIK